MILIFFWISLILFWLYRIVVLLFISNRKWKNKKKKRIDNKKYFIVLPVYKEEKTIRKTISYYESLLKWYNNIKLIVVWTCNERNSDWINITLSIAKNFENSNLIILESENKWWNMATQVNFWVKYIRDILREDINNTYFHLINIDSRITKEGLGEIFNAISEWHNILLQSTLFISNYNRLNSIQRAIAVYQSRRTLVEEQYRILFNNNISKYKLYHVAWHWLIIRLKEYFENKMLPEDTVNEDLHFWFYLAVNWEKVYPLINYEYWDTPNTFVSWIKQTISRFYWNIEYYKYPKLYMEKFWKNFSFKLFLFTIQWFFNTFKWFFTSYALIFSFVLYILYDKIIWLIWFFVYYIHYYIFYYYLLKKNTNLKYKVYDLFTILFIPIFVSFPLTISIIKYCLYKMNILSFIKNKTEHE